jgi:hypothetical protein
VGNNATNTVDPSGLEFEPVGKGGNPQNKPGVAKPLNEGAPTVAGKSDARMEALESRRMREKILLPPGVPSAPKGIEAYAKEWLETGPKGQTNGDLLEILHPGLKLQDYGKTWGFLGMSDFGSGKPYNCFCHTLYLLSGDTRGVGRGGAYSPFEGDIDKLDDILRKAGLKRERFKEPDKANVSERQLPLHKVQDRKVLNPWEDRVVIGVIASKSSNLVQHLAYLLEDGRWVSKLGDGPLIWHSTLEQANWVGGQYKIVAVFHD